MPNYNYGKYLKETVSSVLNQTYKNIEVLFLDNASTDNSLEVINSFHDKRLKIYKNAKNIGYSKNVNKGIKLAKGRYITIYHSDDIYNKRIIEEEVEVLEKNPTAAGVFALSKIIDDKGNLITSYSLPFDYNKSIFTGDKNKFLPLLLKHGNFFVCPTSMIRKKVYDDIGLYTLEYKIIEDFNMWLRILEKYSLSIINKCLIKYRRHEKQETIDDINIYNNTKKYISADHYLYDYYIKGKPVKVDRKIISDILFKIGYAYLFKNDLKNAKKYFWMSIKKYPLHLRYIKTYIKRIILKIKLNKIDF